MIRAINAWAFPGEMTFEEVFKKAKEHGFEGIELNMDALIPEAGNHCFSCNSTEEDFQKVRELIARYGIEVQSLACSTYWNKAMFGSSDPEKKNFAIGVRIEHKQDKISARQYGPSWNQLPPSDYKLACHLPSGRSAFTFCVCPGGQVVAAASEPEQVVTKGMSLRARDGKNINGGFLVGVGPQDFPGEDVLAGVLFQEQWERRAWEVGGRNCCAPAQRVEDFLLDRPSEGAGGILPTYRPGVTWGKVSEALPDVVSETLRGALPVMDRKLKGFACGDAVLTGIESRSSSPVRILRDEHFQSALRGLYPCGEGAGYAGGIVSAAVDGIRVAEAVAGGSL